MSTRRFSKAALIEMLKERIAVKQKEYGFDYGNGYAQVKYEDDYIKHEYGQWRAWVDLVNELSW